MVLLTLWLSIEQTRMYRNLNDSYSLQMDPKLFLLLNLHLLLMLLVVRLLKCQTMVKVMVKDASVKGKDIKRQPSLYNAGLVDKNMHASFQVLSL